MTNTTCAHCGKPFDATRSTATFCSVRCRVAFHRIADPKGKEQRGYYCYTHTTPDGKVFYVGKGRKGRAWDLKSRSEEHAEIVAQHGWGNIKVDIFPATTEEEALHCERFLINACFGLDNLTNKAHGREPTDHRLTNAEKQAAYRKRQAEKLKQLRAQLRAQPQPAAPSMSGLYLDNLTVDEYGHLLKELTNMRKKAAKQEEMKAAKSKSEPKPDKPAPGRYWFVGFDRKLACYVVRDMTIKEVDGTRRSSCALTYSKQHGWRVRNENVGYTPHTMHTTRDGAEREATDENVANGCKARPFVNTSDVELRRIRSEHHPDKGNGHADPTLYQQAVEELDRRRGTPS